VDYDLGVCHPRVLVDFEEEVLAVNDAYAKLILKKWRARTASKAVA
jgi:hypothetical protein